MSVTIGVSRGEDADGWDKTDPHSLSELDEKSKSNGATRGRLCESHLSFNMLSSSASMSFKYISGHVMCDSASMCSSDSMGRGSTFDTRLWWTPFFWVVKTPLFECTVLDLSAESLKRAIGLFSCLIVVISSFGCLMSLVDGTEPLS